MSENNMKKVRTVAEEAAKLLKENPEWSYAKAIKEAKDLMK